MWEKHRKEPLWLPSLVYGFFSGDGVSELLRQQTIASHKLAQPALNLSGDERLGSEPL